ncbi:LOW QUALITY PROTEIN: dynein heavy chain domain-containing protein 1 [Ctenodactylus gundi]
MLKHEKGLSLVSGLKRERLCAGAAYALLRGRPSPPWAPSPAFAPSPSRLASHLRLNAGHSLVRPSLSSQPAGEAVRGRGVAASTLALVERPRVCPPLGERVAAVREARVQCTRFPAGASPMKRPPRSWRSSFHLPPLTARPGGAPQPRAWNWRLDPELWARSLRQKLNAQLLLEDESAGLPSDEESSSDAVWARSFVSDQDGTRQPWPCQRKQRQLPGVVTDPEQLKLLELLLAELQTLFSAVLQDCSPAAWRYLHAVLGLLPPYRELLAGQLLPFLEHLYCWAPWVQSHLQLDLLGAIHQTFLQDSSSLCSASHEACQPRKMRRQPQPPCPACSSAQTQRGGQQGRKELATWLRPLTLPELQRSLGIVGAEVALEETQRQSGLSLLPLALATDIPVPYQSVDMGKAEEEPAARGEAESPLVSEVPGKKPSPKSTGLALDLSSLGSHVKTTQRTNTTKTYFLYLNVAPGPHFRPYDLVVVPPNKVNPEYYILSPFGVLHVHPEEGTEAISLDTWDRHCALWHQLQCIPFFKNFLIHKALIWWKKKIKLQVLRKLQTFLGSHLLLVVPHFGVGLLHMNRLLQELHSVSWLPQEPDQCYELPDLQKAVAKENHKALHLLLRCLNLRTSIVRLVHEDTYQMQQRLQEQVQNCHRIRTDQGSIYLQRVECQQLEQRLKQAETWLWQLGKFARLIDCMICENLISILEDEITSFVANVLQAPRQKPFLRSQVVCSDCGQLSLVPSIENMIQALSESLQSTKTSALQVMQSAGMKTCVDSLHFEADDEEEDSNTELSAAKSQGHPSRAAHIFSGPNVGLVWPWKSHPIANLLEVRGHRLRGQYLPPSYNQLQENLDKSLPIQQALTIQQALMEGMLQEVQEFCREHYWITDICEFLKAWGPEKLEDIKGCPIKNYMMLMSRLSGWQSLVSCMPVELLTTGNLLQLDCRAIQAELESKLDSVRKDILTQVQKECYSRSQQLMTELRGFIQVFQVMSSDVHAIAKCSQKLNEANEQYTQLEERMEYIRSLYELICSHFGFFSAENEAQDIAVRGDLGSHLPSDPLSLQPHLLPCPLLAPQLLDLWKAFQFEKLQASEFLLSKQYAIVPRLQQLMAAALVELDGLLQKALSDPFMDLTQDPRSTERQLLSLENQFQDTVSHLSDLQHACVIFTGDESPVSLPICGNRPIVQQRHIWRLYRVISETISEWKCMAFVKFSLSAAQEKTDGWLAEVAEMRTTLAFHSPVLQGCIHMLEEFCSYLPLLKKLGGFQRQSLNYQSLLRALTLGSIQNMELLTLGQLLACPLLEFTDLINQVWQCENEQINAQVSLQQLQQSWEMHQLRLVNFILHVPYESPPSGHSRRQVPQRFEWKVVDKDSGTFILSDYTSLQDSIQEALQVLFKVLAIQKSGGIHKIALDWVTIMQSLGALLEIWMDLQQKWIFLNKVLYEMNIEFPSADLKTRFKAVDDQYRTLMHISVADPLVLSLIMPSAKRSPYFQGQQLQQLLHAGSMELEGIIIALETVLYGICAHFPRLFFLSDSELVALLAAPLELSDVQLWVRRCFPHVHALSFKSNPTDEKNTDDLESSPSRLTETKAVAVLGEGQEEVQLQKPLPLHPDLPQWLASLEKSLHSTLVCMLPNCVAARLALCSSTGEIFKQSHQQSQLSTQLRVQPWLDLAQAFPWQCVLVAEEVVWWAEMEEALLMLGTPAMTSRQIHKLEVLVHSMQAQRNSQGGQPLLTIHQTSLLSALLVMAVSHRDVAQLLEKHQVSDPTDFHWARQFKYHLGLPHLIPQSPLQSLQSVVSTEPSLPPAACWIDMLGRSFLYNYEYLGPRLGPFPSLLPERSVLVLLMALEEVACGTLLGPDGVGKTSTVSSLAQALGHQLVMIPCLPQLETRCLSNYLHGALQGGAWLLLEGVHHLPPGMLSALGQRLAELHSLYAPLYQKVSQNISTIDPTEPQLLGSGYFEKHQVSVRLGYGCFLTLRTLSPAVPANLHLLLRPVALALPDLQQLAELTLLGAGVQDATSMATRLSKFFSLEHELVSGPVPCRMPLLKQILKETIQTLNATKEDLKSQNFCSLAATEEAALLRALLRSPLFSILDGLHLQNLRELLCGIFPSASQVLAEPATHRLMKPLMVEDLQQVGLHPSPDLLGSLEQLSAALSRGSGVLLLGPAGSGKTTCWHSLSRIQNRLAAMKNNSAQSSQYVKISHMYPSVLSSQELLGWLEGPYWHYGIFPRLLCAFPQCNSTSPKEQAEGSVRIQHWVVCDGASSPAWLESITCLLSEPSLLSLPNGQQIVRPRGTFLLMEMTDATGLSPTLVGRCALVWCGGKQTWQGMLSILMAALPQEYRLQARTVTMLTHLADVMVPAMFQFLTCKGASSVLQVHGQQAVCPGVAEVTSLTRILRSLLDPYLRLDEEQKSHGPEEVNFRVSGSSFVNVSRPDSDDSLDTQRDHFLAISSFLFALIWGFGGHLPSRLWPLFDTFIRSSVSSLSGYPELPPAALVFDLHVNPEDGTLVPFAGQYLSSRIKGTLGTFYPSLQTERLLYVVELLLSKGHPVLLAGEAATGKSAFMQVLVEPNHPYVHSAIHPAFSSTHLRLLLSRGVQGQAPARPLSARRQHSKGSLLFLLEDLHLASSDAEKHCQPVLETLRQALDGTVYVHSTLELRALQPTVNFLATATVPGGCESPLCPRLFRRFTVLALGSITQATLLSRHSPSIQAWLEHFPYVEREGALAKALVRASAQAWETVCHCFVPSPLHPHYHLSLHSVSHLLESLQLVSTRIGSWGFEDLSFDKDYLNQLSGLRGTRLTVTMTMRTMVRLWLHEAQRTFCDRLDSPSEREHCAKLLLGVAQSVFCGVSVPQCLDKDLVEEEEKAHEAESEGELGQWEDLSSSDSETEEEEDTYGLQAATSTCSCNPSLLSPTRSVNTESLSHKIEQEEGTRALGYKLQPNTSKTRWLKVSQMDLTLPLLLPVLLLRPQENPSDLIFSQELTLELTSEHSNLYLERQWEKLQEQLATSAAQLKLSPHLARCRPMVQHVARLVRVLARPRQHGLLLSGALGTGRHTAITLATGICQVRLFHLPSGPEEAVLQCLRDASWHAGMFHKPVALLVPQSVELTTFHQLVVLATLGSFPDQYTEADLDNIEEQLPRENLGVNSNAKKETMLQRFYQQVCSHLHMFFLVGDDQVQKKLPSTLFLKLLQLTTASIDHYEPWDQASLTNVAHYHLESSQNLSFDDGSLKCPDLQESIPNVAKAMALIHLSAGYYHEHLCPVLPLVTPKTFLDFLDTFQLLRKQMTLQMQNRARRIQNALDTLRNLIEQHSIHTNTIVNLEQQLKDSHKNLSVFQGQLQERKLLYRKQLAKCQHQERLIENLGKQRDALQAQHEAFLEQMGKAFLGPLSQLQVTDFEEIRSYRTPPESVVCVTNTLCDLFHRKTGWDSAKQLLTMEDFYQELVFFPKEKMTDSELKKLDQALKAPGMSVAALRAVSIPAANLVDWLRAVLRYGMAQRQALPTGLQLQQVEAALAQEQARLGHCQFQAQEMLEHILTLTKKVEDAHGAYSHVVKTLHQAQGGQYKKWPVESALVTPMHTWTAELEKLKGHCLTVLGDTLLCSAAITYLGPFPPPRRQELLDKWLALCRGFQEDLGPDDVAQALDQKSVIVPSMSPLLPTRFPFNILYLMSCATEKYHWDPYLKPEAKSAQLAGLILRSYTHYYSCRWPLLLDPSNQALIWLSPLPLEENKCLVPAPTEDREEKETESQGPKVASETQSPPRLRLSVLSGTDPELGPRLQQAAASGRPVLLTNMELGLECQELQRLLSREQLSPPQVQPGFCLYLSTTLPFKALEKVLGCELIKRLNVLDLGLNMEILEKQMLRELVGREQPELKSRWQDLKIRVLDACSAVEAAEEQLLTTVQFQNPKHRKPIKFLWDVVRIQAKICQMHVLCEELKEQKMQEVVLWRPYQQVVGHAVTIVKTLSPIQNLEPFFHMSTENWIAEIRQVLDSMDPQDVHHREDLACHLLHLKKRLTRQLLGSTLNALGLTRAPLVGALGALALLQGTDKASKLERLALWPGLAASPSVGHCKSGPGVARPPWLGLQAWRECAILELLPPFVGLRASLANLSNVWQDYLSLSPTVLGPAPGPSSEPLSLLQKLILWRVLCPERLAEALEDLTTSLLGRPLDENLGVFTLPLEHSQATQPILILLPPPGHPTAILHPLTVIQKLAAKHEQGQKHLQVVALGSEAWNPVSAVVSTLRQAMLKGQWLVLDNCHLMSHWPRELLQPLLGLLDGAKVVSDLELEPQSGNVATVHRDFRLWLVASAKASDSLPAVLTQHSRPVFWDHSLELGHILADSLELAQEGLHVQSPARVLPLVLLHGLLLHRQLYRVRLQAHRGHWTQGTLTQVLQTQEQLWFSLSNPRTAMQELAASVFYGGPLGDPKDREALISLTQACLDFRSWSRAQPHTPQHLLATLMPSPGEPDAMAECKARLHLLPKPPEPLVCGLSEDLQAWLSQGQSRSLLSALQQSSAVWVPARRRSGQQAERRLQQRLVLARRRLESLQALLSECHQRDRTAPGLSPRRPLEDFLETEAAELRQLAGALQSDLDCLLLQLTGTGPCASRRCAAVARALWTGRLPAPWRPHTWPRPQPPWRWLRQLSRRGQLLARYLGLGAEARAEAAQRVFHLSAFRRPRRLLLALRWEAALRQRAPGSNLPGSPGWVQTFPELSSVPLHFRVEDGPAPAAPEMGVLLIGLQLLHAEWDSTSGALRDSPSSRPSPLPPVSVSTRNGHTPVLPTEAGLPVYACPVYQLGPLGTSALHSRNVLMHLPLPSGLSLATCIQRRVYVGSPPLP